MLIYLRVVWQSMNEFLQKKLGEVLAFARLGSDTLDKGREGFVQIMQPQELDTLKERFNNLEQKVAGFAAQEDVTQKVEESASKTQEKVSSMRDTYIGDSWNESSEVLEWMGFYTGASLVHWYLVQGAAQQGASVTPSLNTLGDIASEAIALYGSLFSADEKFLQGIGAKAM